MLGSGSEGGGVGSAPGELKDRLQGVTAGSTASATSVFHQGPEHSLATFLAVEFGQQSFSMTPRVPGARGALASCLGPLGDREGPEVSVCVNPASLEGPRAPICGHR